MSGRSFSFLISIMLAFSSVGLCQHDSLRTLLSQATNDTMRCKILVEMIETEGNDEVWSKYNSELKQIAERNLAEQRRGSYLHRFFSNYYAQAYANLGYLAYKVSEFRKARGYMLKSLAIQQEIDDKVGIASTLNNIGTVHESQGEYLEALDYFQKAVALNKEIGAKHGEGSSLNNIAVIFIRQGNIPRGLEYLQKSLKIQEEIGDKSGLASTLNNMGSIYQDQGDIVSALTVYERGLRLQEELGSRGGQANFLNNIGTIHAIMGDTLNALEHMLKALDIQEQIGDKGGAANSLLALGDIYRANKQLQKSLPHYRRSLEIARSIGDRASETAALTKLGYNLLEVGKTMEAFSSGREALKISEELAYPKSIRESALLMKALHQKLGQHAEALKMFELYILMRDSVNNIASRKAALKTQLKYEFDKKEALLIGQQENERQLAEEKSRRQNLVIWSALSGVLLLVVLSFFIYNRLRITRRQKQIIERQKLLVDEQKREIMDSIHYAKRIQLALLSGESLLSGLLPEHFIFFRPKSVVSGDFYWATSVPDGLIYITADCTGHGVPGAFMSLLIISRLSRIINEEKITRPDLILNEIRKEIIHVLNPHNKQGEGNDGMDCVVCRLDLKHMKLGFAAANNSFVIARNGGLLHCRADKMPVGKGYQEEVPFSFNEIQLQRGDSIYTYSDGYADQFGGPKSKKFRYKQLEEFLLEISSLPMTAQKERLSVSFDNWKGGLEQVDDVCVIGLRI